jgi:hypothetical protein
MLECIFDDVTCTLPEGSRLLIDWDAVSKTLALLYGTLSDANWSIHMICSYSTWVNQAFNTFKGIYHYLSCVSHASGETLLRQQR